MWSSGLGGERGQVFLSLAHPCLGPRLWPRSAEIRSPAVSVIGDAFPDRMEPRLSELSGVRSFRGSEERTRLGAVGLS